MVKATQRLAKMKTSPSSTVKEADPRSRTPCPTSAWRTAPSPWISLLRPHRRKSLAVSGAEVPLLSGGASRLKLICLLRRLLVFKSSLETLTFCAWTPLTSRSFACFKVVLVVWGHWAPALCCSAVQWCCCVVLRCFQVSSSPLTTRCPTMQVRLRRCSLRLSSFLSAGVVLQNYRSSIVNWLAEWLDSLSVSP